MRTLRAELKKSRRRYNTLVAVSIALFVLLWATQTDGTGEKGLKQGYSGLLYAVPVMNTVVMPLGMAVLASRGWDLESKEKSCRMLLTLQSRGELFLGKAAVALLQILLIGAIETLGIPVLGRHFGFTEVLDRRQLGWLAICTFAVNGMLFFLFFLLSIRFDNQVPALAAGMVGSLSGLFSAYMPLMVSYCMPWSYYIPLSTIRLDWNPETKAIRYYAAPYPVWLLIITVALGAVFAAATWETLKQKEV